MPEEEKQDIQLHFRVTRREKEIIEQKMAQMGTKRLGVYLRKMAIDGYVVRLDLPEIHELVVQLKKYGANLNQLAKLSNYNGCIFADDIVTLKTNHEHLFALASIMIKRMTEF